ncbi:MAG: M36 family metallopeptidase [Myxococcota bacterium]|nr:M36 family metallopeptidase [Myxococcota bacterium]
MSHKHVYLEHKRLDLELEDVEDFEYEGHESKHNATTHMNLRQRIRGVPIRGANMGLAVRKDGRVVGRWSDFIPRARGRINRIDPDLDAEDALSLVAPLLGLSAPDEIVILESAAGPMRSSVLEGGTLSRDPIPAKLVYQPLGNQLRLAWDFVIRTPDGRHWWNIQVDTETGELLEKVDWIAHETYRVFGPAPVLTPDEGPHVITSPPSLVNAPIPSPYGWHDTNGIPGAEFTDTRGNNVHAQEDQDANDTGGIRPDGGPGLVFNFPFASGLAPSTYQSASIANLFYWNNVAHDLFYQYGFDEASGNFQVNNYGRGGTDGDPVRADAHDGGGTNNAQFGTPPDGFQGIMEMFLWTGAVQLAVISPAPIAGVYSAAGAAFGPELPSPALGGSVVAGLDSANPAGPTSTDGCSAFTNVASVNGNIALVDRGTCDFVDKVANAQAAGATAVIVANNAGENLVSMGGTNPFITIPSIFIGQSDGALIRSNLGSVDVSLNPSVMRDGSMDAGIILHEYGHGVSNRLTGGAANSGCLSAIQSSGMGEGWSDFFALFMGTRVGDIGTGTRLLGSYILSQPPNGQGLRSQPYSTDMTTNTLTLVDIETANQPHGIGEVWATALWEVFWELVDAHGFDSDVYEGTGGNNLAMQLVMDGLKLQTCNPTFIEARDAVLLAESNITDEINQCLVWRAFAKRGLGAAATVSSNPSNLVTSEDFTLPATCSEFCADGVTNAGEQCDDANLIDLDGCSQTCRTEESYTFQGVAAGGTVEFVIEGESVIIMTLPGETAADVALKMATEISANASLASLGATGQANGDVVVVAGAISSTIISDTGLAPAVPLGDWLPGILALILLFSGISWLQGHKLRNHDQPETH